MRLRFVDRILALEPCRSVRVTKCVSLEEACLDRRTGVPPTLMLEWLGQAAMALVGRSTNYTFLPLAGSVQRCTFSGTPRPGDLVTLEIQIRSWHPGEAHGDAWVRGPDGEEILRVEGSCFVFVPLDALFDREEFRTAIERALAPAA